METVCPSLAGWVVVGPCLYGEVTSTTFSTDIKKSCCPEVSMSLRRKSHVSSSGLVLEEAGWPLAHRREACFPANVVPSKTSSNKRCAEASSKEQGRTEGRRSQCRGQYFVERGQKKPWNLSSHSVPQGFLASATAKEAQRDHVTRAHLL